MSERTQAALDFCCMLAGACALAGLLWLVVSSQPVVHGGDDPKFDTWRPHDVVREPIGGGR